MNPQEGGSPGGKSHQAPKAKKEQAQVKAKPQQAPLEAYFKKLVMSAKTIYAKGI